MKRKLIIYTLALLTIFNVATLATFAYHRWSIEREMRALPPDDPGLQHLEELGLDSIQISAIREARDSFHEESSAVNDELFRLQSRVFDQMHSDTPDTSVIFPLIDSIGIAQKALHKMAITHMINEGSIFTNEQRDRLLTRFKKQMRKRWDRRGGMHRGGGLHRPPFGMQPPDSFGPRGGGMPGPGMNPGGRFKDDSQHVLYGKQHRMNDRTDVTNRDSNSSQTDSPSQIEGNQGGN